MLTAFCFGLGTAFAAGLAGNYTWRRLPSTLGALPVVLGATVVTASVTIAAHLHLHVAGLGIPALVVGLIFGGNVAHGLSSPTPQGTR